MEPGRSSGPSAGRCRLSGPLSHQCEKPRVTPKGRALRCGPPRPPHGPHPSRHVVTPCGVRLSCRPRRRHPCPLWGSQMQGLARPPSLPPASGLSGLNAGFIVPQVWPTVRDDCPGEDSVLVTALTRTGHARPRRSPEWGGRRGSGQRPLLRVPWKEQADGASRLRAVWAECRPARAQGPCCLVRPRVIRVGTVAWKAQFWAVVYSL